MTEEIKSEGKNLLQTSGKSLQNLNDLPDGTVVEGAPIVTNTTEALKSNDAVIVSSGDKSPESLKAEASGSDGMHALSNETPSKQDGMNALNEKRAKGEITELEFRKRLAVLEQSIAAPILTAEQGQTFAPAPPKLPIEQFIEPNPIHRMHQTSTSAILKPENKVEYERLLKEAEDAKGDRQLGDIPLSDSYWVKQNAVTVFLANMRS